VWGKVADVFRLFTEAKGKTPVWSREDAKTLLDSIPKEFSESRLTR
jgi:hypothetical protein